MDWIGSIAQKIRDFFKPTTQNPQSQKIMLTKLMQMVDQTQEEEDSCDDVLQLLDEYAEMVSHGEDAEKMMPLIKHHLDMCPDCREEAEALLSVIKSQQN
ncbi:MAG: zf-HC2 domain-containing protein [Anaerolineaceae bacterium]|nr:zf-HC2 domain-containing protein [Anaerolineaceae bacterium]